jgi:hypothetical protein
MSSNSCSWLEGLTGPTESLRPSGFVGTSLRSFAVYALTLARLQDRVRRREEVTSFRRQGRLFPAALFSRASRGGDRTRCASGRGYRLGADRGTG